ncbi:hypothetical protein GCM10027203_73110 [Nonomuraea fastidiosa]
MTLTGAVVPAARGWARAGCARVGSCRLRAGGLVPAARVGLVRAARVGLVRAARVGLVRAARGWARAGGLVRAAPGGA